MDDHRIERCKRYRRRILEISQTVTAAHVAPAFSCMEIVDCIYNELMRDQDIFVMSKGHGCLAQYVVLEERGFDLSGYCNGDLGAHPDLNPPWIAASTGSLGHGLGMAVGMAIAERLKGTDTIIYCLISDGELQAGSTWEAIMAAANHRLENLVVFVDNNDFGGLEAISVAQPAVYPIGPKFEASGWKTQQLGNGHDTEFMAWVVKANPDREGPIAIICRTIKGKGVPFMEGVASWHYRSPAGFEYQQALEALS